MRMRLSKIVEITTKIDKIASDLEKDYPKLALALDSICDRLENRKFAGNLKTDWAQLKDPKILEEVLQGIKQVQDKPKMKAAASVIAMNPVAKGILMALMALAPSVFAQESALNEFKLELKKAPRMTMEQFEDVALNMEQKAKTNIKKDMQTKVNEIKTEMASKDGLDIPATGTTAVGKERLNFRNKLQARVLEMIQDLEKDLITKFNNDVVTKSDLDTTIKTLVDAYKTKLL